LAKGGATVGGTTSAAGQPATGGSATGGAASGGSATGGKPTGGSASGGSATGGKPTGGSDTGGSATGGNNTGGSATGGSDTGGSTADAAANGGSTAGDAAAGGKTESGGSSGGPDGAAAGGKTATGGSASGGTAAGGATGTGGVTPLGGGKGSSDGKTPIKVWMAGDSTMSGSGCDGGGWGDQFGAVFNSNVTIENKSVAGRSIQTWLYEGAVTATAAGANKDCTLSSNTYSANWNAMLDANTGMKPGDYLFVQFGINDGSPCPRFVSTTLFETYLTTMAKAASDRGAEAIFLTPTNAIMCTGSTADANTRGAYPAAVKAAGTADNVPVIDVTTLTGTLYTSLGLCPNAGDYTSTTSKVGQFFCNDHTHFSPAGALQIAQTVGQALKDQGIGLAAYLK
jgi:lysophospholipase L1-like esterase